MPLGRNLYPPTRDTRIAGSQRDITRLQRRLYRPGPWQYATPLSPAPDPSDLSDSGEGTAFENGWGNIALPDGSWSPLRWRFSHDGRVELVGAIDGGALDTVCVTLPSSYRPLENVLAAVSSTDGSRVMTVKIDATSGDVTVVGIPEASAVVGDGQVGTSQLADGSVTDAKLSDSGVTAGTYGDASHVAVVTVNAKGRVTGAVSTAIAVAEAAVTGLVTDLASKVAKSLFGAKGDLLVATAASTPTNLAVGPDGDVLTADATQPTGVKWAAPSGGASPLTTKGDLFGHSTVDARIPLGSNGQVLTADSTQTLGLKWATAAAGGDTLHTVASSGAAQTVDYGTADVWDVTLTAACTLTLAGFTNGQPDFLTLILRQDATGSRAITWPTITWIGSGIPPILQIAPGSVDSVVLFSFDGGTTVYGIAQTSASGLRSGTSFPGSPSDGDLFYRTDRRILYEYDSASGNWLSVNRSYMPFAYVTSSTSTGNVQAVPIPEKIYVEKIAARTFASTNNASNYWTVAFNKVTTANVATAITSFATSADAASSWVTHDISIGSILDPATNPVIFLNVAKTGSPSPYNIVSGLIVRSVG